jgi:hypothetical protein
MQAFTGENSGKKTNKENDRTARLLKIPKDGLNQLKSRYRRRIRNKTQSTAQRAKAVIERQHRRTDRSTGTVRPLRPT